MFVCILHLYNIIHSITCNTIILNTEVFLSYFPDLSHISLKSLLQILCQHWFDNKFDEKILLIYERIENDYKKFKIFITNYVTNNV